MAENRVSVPVLGGSYTYSTRDTGGAWSAETVLGRGIDEDTQNFVCPVLCDEIRFKAVFQEPVLVDRVNLSGLNIHSGLTFNVQDIEVGQTLDFGDFAQHDYQFKEQTHRQVIRLPERLMSEPQIIITGLNQVRLNVRHLCFASLGWIPDYCHSYGYLNDSAYTFEEINTGGSSYSILSSRLLDRSVSYSNQSRLSYRTLAEVQNHKLRNGLCLFERDIESDDNEDSFMARIRMGQVGYPEFANNQFDLGCKEAFVQ